MLGGSGITPGRNPRCCLGCDGCGVAFPGSFRSDREVERRASEAGWTHFLILDRPGSNRGYPAAYCPECLPKGPEATFQVSTNEGMTVGEFQ